MVQHLHRRVEQYYWVYGGRHVNYEDLYYLAEQMHDEEQGEAENPAIRPFFRTVKTNIWPLIKIIEKEYIGHAPPNNFRDLLGETCNYITDIVSKQIYKSAKESVSVSHLEAIAKACNSGNVTSISTLCHDDHLETFLKKQGLVLSDGFSEPKDYVRYWEGDFSLDGNKVPFLKLHGSINWYRRQCDQHICSILPGYQCEGDDDLGRPKLLIGTFNKIQQYSSGIFRDLHYHFRSTLREANQIIICGYGFGDKGINSEIINWYYEKEGGRRLLVIHPNSEKLRKSARGAISKKWEEWLKKDGLKLIPKKFEDVKEGELLEYLKK